MRSAVRSFAPPTLLPAPHKRLQGYGASNIWKQRALRWFVNAPRRLVWRFLLLVYYDCDEPGRNGAFMIFSLLHIARIWILFQLPLELYFMYVNAAVGWLGFWFVTVHVLVTLECSVINWVVWRGRPSMQVSWQTVALQSFYFQFLTVCMFVGHWRSLLYYIPVVPMNYRGSSGNAHTKHGQSKGSQNILRSILL